MTKQVRDWQEDIKLVEAYKHAQTLHNIPYPRKLSWEDNLSEPTELILEYWLQQYAAEKERADKLEERNKALIAAVTADTNGTFRCVEEARSEAAETREKKLREALETAIPEVFTGVVRRQLKDLLALLYPKEEAK